MKISEEKGKTRTLSTTSSFSVAIPKNSSVQQSLARLLGWFVAIDFVFIEFSKTFSASCPSNDVMLGCGSRNTSFFLSIICKENDKDIPLNLHPHMSKGTHIGSASNYREPTTNLAQVRVWPYISTSLALSSNPSHVILLHGPANVPVFSQEEEEKSMCINIILEPIYAICIGTSIS